MMSHPHAVPADPCYKTEDVERLMKSAAAILAATDTGAIDLGAIDDIAVCVAFDEVEFAIEALRKSVLDNVARHISPEPVRVNAAVELPLPNDVDVKLVAVVCNAEFQNVCGYYRQTPAEVIAGFVADASGVDDATIGYCTGGSDERNQAADYIDRRFGWIRAAHLLQAA